jgi:hypothetical protein
MYKVHAMYSDGGKYKNHPHGYWLITFFTAYQAVPNGHIVSFSLHPDKFIFISFIPSTPKRESREGKRVAAHIQQK